MSFHGRVSSQIPEQIATTEGSTTSLRVTLNQVMNICPPSTAEMCLHLLAVPCFVFYPCCTVPMLAPFLKDVIFSIYSMVNFLCLCIDHVVWKLSSCWRRNLEEVTLHPVALC